MTITDNGSGSYTLQLTVGERQAAQVLIRRYGAAALKDRFENVLERGVRELEEEIREAWRDADAATKAQVKALLGVN